MSQSNNAWSARYQAQADAQKAAAKAQRQQAQQQREAELKQQAEYISRTGRDTYQVQSQNRSNDAWGSRYSEQASKRYELTKMRKRVKKNPTKDYDKDGIPNALDPNSWAVTPLSPQPSKLPARAIFKKTEIDMTGFDFPSSSKTESKAVSFKEMQKYAEKKADTIATKRGIDKNMYHTSYDTKTGKFYFSTFKERPDIDNKKYNSRLDFDGDGTSGTKRDYKTWVDNKNRGGKPSPIDGKPTVNTGRQFTGDQTQNSPNQVNRSNRRNGSGTTNNDKRSGDNPAKAVGKKDTPNNKNRGGANLIPDPNGDNLLARFTKVYGAEAPAKMREAIDAYNASGAGTITETYQIGQYGYNVKLKSGDKTLTNTDDIKTELVKFAPASSTQETTLARLQLIAAQGGGTEKGLTRRFANAYAGGDKDKGNQVLAAAAQAYAKKNPGKLEVHGTLGQPGAYISVKVNGEWTSNSDVVSKTLAGHVKSADGEKQPFEKHSREQQAFLSGANGTAVLNRLNLAMQTTGTQTLEKAIMKYNRANGGAEMRAHGTMGTSNFWVEVKTKNGWTSDTDAVLNKLKPYASASVASDDKPAQDTGPAGVTLDPKKKRKQDLNGSGTGTGVSKKDPSLPDSPAVRADDKKSSGSDISISEAAKKSQAFMAADLNKDGAVSAKEQTVLNAADRNNSGTVSVKEATRFVAMADTNNDGLTRTEAKAYKMVDSNDNGKISKKELKAFKSIAGKDGEISRKEAKQALKAQIDSKQDQREHDLAVEYLKKTSNKTGGSQDVSEQAAALVNAQQNKPKKQDNDGPGKKKKK